MQIVDKKMKKNLFYCGYFVGLTLFFSFFIFLLFSRVPRFFDLTLFFWGNIITGALCLLNYYSSNDQEKEGEIWWQNLIGFHCCIQSLAEILPFNKLFFLLLLTTLTSSMIYIKAKKIGNSTERFKMN